MVLTGQTDGVVVEVTLDDVVAVDDVSVVVAICANASTRAL